MCLEYIDFFIRLDSLASVSISSLMYVKSQTAISKGEYGFTTHITAPFHLIH